MKIIHFIHFLRLRKKKEPLSQVDEKPLINHPNISDLLFGYTRVHFGSGVECSEVIPVLHPKAIFPKSQTSEDKQQEIFSQVDSKWKYVTLLLPYDIREEILGDLLETRHVMLNLQVPHAMTDPTLALNILKSWWALCETWLQDFYDWFRRS